LRRPRDHSLRPVEMIGNLRRDLLEELFVLALRERPQDRRRLPAGVPILAAADPNGARKGSVEARDEFLGCGHAWRDRAAANASLRDQQTGSPADIRVVRKGQTQFGFNFFRASGESNCLSSSEGRMGVCLPRDHRPTGRSILEQLICGAHARPIAGRPLIGAAPATAWRRRYEGQWRSKPRPCNARR
jgi:hypothetical protein